MIIQNNAIFIADAHYNVEREDLFTLLSHINNNHIQCSQLFLMGDIFDFLADEIEYFKLINQKIISLINNLSISHEVIYLEGNHDFNLANIFPKTKIITRESQPFYIKQNGINIALAHGDIFMTKSYEFFTSIFRNHKFLQFINFIDFSNIFTQFAEKKLLQKTICHEMSEFFKFIDTRIQNYNDLKKTDLIIEGHYHQGYIGNNYINIPSLACNNKYLIYQNKQFSFNTL